MQNLNSEKLIKINVKGWNSENDSDKKVNKNGLNSTRGHHGYNSRKVFFAKSTNKKYNQLKVLNLNNRGKKGVNESVWANAGLLYNKKYLNSYYFAKHYATDFDFGGVCI